MTTLSKSEHQLEAYGEVALHTSEEIHCTDISPVIEVIPHRMTIETTLHDLGKLHGRSHSKLCLWHI